MSVGLSPGSFLFASEAAAEGCSDKLCDRVADAVLDACLAQDPEAHVSCDAVTKSSMVMILGEVCTKASVNYEQVIREAVKCVGYDRDDKGLDWRTMNVIVAVEEPAADFSQVTGGTRGVQEVRDSGTVSGYATDESPEMVPVSHALATRLCAQLDRVRKEGALTWARPGGTAQVVVEYSEKPDGSVAPAGVKSVSLSVPRAAGIAAEQAQQEVMQHVVKPVLPESLCNSGTQYRFPDPKDHVRSDVGFSGKRIAEDTYGGWGLPLSAALSGRGSTRLSRSAAYGARWAAQSLVAAKLCKRATVQLSYAAGIPEPVSISVNSHGTSRCYGKTDVELADTLRRNFDFRPSALARDLGLKSPQFQKLSAYGHFGRTDLDVAWERPLEMK
mmetsp:Transcript_19427/g.56424  ORF Transcript_19427/g.56424 Transcript_19427/m.56424 type:complete len:387 (-) Transcript_19427:95-1255(-)